MLRRSTYLIIMLLLSTTLFSAHVDTKAFPLDAYDDLTLNGAFEVLIYQGDKEEVILEGPEHLIQEIIVRQRGSRVVVGDKPQHTRSLRKIKVYVYLKNIHKLEINGISRLECRTPIQSDHLRLYCNGIRDVEFDLHLGDLIATFDGIGSTYLSGVAHTADIQCAGLGNIYAREMKVDILHFESAGIGKAEIYAGTELHVAAAGIGSVRYAGNPEIKSISKDGIGKVRAMW